MCRYRHNVDNGSAFVDSQLLRACASLGIALVHSRPGQPAGRGKIERVFRTVREQFLVEIVDPPEGAGSPVSSLAELNSLFTAWVEQVYHRRPHGETGQPPLQRWLAPGPPVLPTRDALHEAFLWSEQRTVTKTATVSLNANTYEVDAALVGHRVELVFDPFDLTDIAVRYQGRAMGPAIPHRIGRHVHRKARPDIDPPPPRRPGSTTCTSSRPPTPPNWPNDCATTNSATSTTTTSTRPARRGRPGPSGDATPRWRPSWPGSQPCSTTTGSSPANSPSPTTSNPPNPSCDGAERAS